MVGEDYSLLGRKKECNLVMVFKYFEEGGWRNGRI